MAVGWACTKGHVNIVKMLIDYGIDIESADAVGYLHVTYVTWVIITPFDRASALC